MALSHDCAQVERDNVDLHQALATAIRRLEASRRQLGGLCFDPLGWPETSTSDLREVLDRTSRAPAPSHQRWAL